MALSIKNPEIDRQVRTLARRLNTSMTGAIQRAVSNELDRTARFSPAETAQRITELEALVGDFDRSTLDWSLTDEEIVGYDKHGIPT
jgi:antitoxin VapB